MQKNALHLIKGRMPKNDHEILLSRHMMTNGGVEYRVGDTITLDISEREDKNGNVLTQSSGYRTGEKLKKKLFHKRQNHLMSAWNLIPFLW